jgi:hypothetical protein
MLLDLSFCWQIFPAAEKTQNSNSLELSLTPRQLFLKLFITERTTSYEARWHLATHSQQRTAIGFMLSFFHLRFASSYKAILDTLARRREKVDAAIEHQHNQSELTEEDWEELVDDECD